MQSAASEKSFRRVLTAEQHGLFGVPVFACAKGMEAVLPMIEHRHKDKYECVLLNGGTRVLTAGGLPYTGKRLFHTSGRAARRRPRDKGCR